MTATSSTLTTGQRELLSLLSDEGRIFRRGDQYDLTTLRIRQLTLTSVTVEALLTAGYLSEVESVGRERSIYTLSALGLAKVAEMRQ